MNGSKPAAGDKTGNINMLSNSKLNYFYCYLTGAVRHGFGILTVTLFDNARKMIN